MLKGCKTEIKPKNIFEKIFTTEKLWDGHPEFPEILETLDVDAFEMTCSIHPGIQVHYSPTIRDTVFTYEPAQEIMVLIT